MEIKDEYKGERIKQNVNVRIQAWRQSTPGRKSQTARELAQLRSVRGKLPEDAGNAWNVIFAGLSTDLYWENGKTSREEWAVFIAFVLFAVQAQGRLPDEDTGKDIQGCSLGRAFGQLAVQKEDDTRVWNYMNRLLRKTKITELKTELFRVCSLLTQANIRLNYGELAEDLYQWQNQRLRPIVRHRWAQTFYNTYNGYVRESKNSKEE